jgi:MFS family permease
MTAALGEWHPISASCWSTISAQLAMTSIVERIGGTRHNTSPASTHRTKAPGGGPGLKPTHLSPVGPCNNAAPRNAPMQLYLPTRPRDHSQVQPSVALTSQCSIMFTDNRWTILFLLFVVRLSMAFQFQSVAAVTPIVMNEFGVGLGDVGLLIGLYLAPGLVIALPGGEIGRRYGDKSAVLFGLALMVGGGLMMMLTSTWSWQLGARLLGGVGGVLLNVLMAKMVTDWFSGKEIATAMAIFVNSWPVGIGLALIVLPPIASIGGLTGVYVATSALALLGLLLLALFYRAPPALIGTSSSGAWPTGVTLRATFAAGCVWGFYNAAFVIIASFGTAMLAEGGLTLTAAGSAVSLVPWFSSLSVPLGGFIADRTGRHGAVMLGGFALFAASLAIAARTDYVIFSFALLGLVGGISAGSILSLPPRVLGAEVRAAGMGIYFTIFYAMIVGGPIAAGWVAAMAGTSRVTFDVAAAMLAGCVIAYWVFEKMRQRLVRDHLAKPR